MKVKAGTEWKRDLSALSGKTQFSFLNKSLDLAVL